MSFREKHGFLIGSFVGAAQYAGVMFVKEHGAVMMVLTSTTIYMAAYWTFTYFTKKK